jgi:hypothetical protein
MKKTCLLTLLGCTLAAAPVMAANYDLWITGSTAFRPNVFAACYKIFDGGAPANAINSSGAAPGVGDGNWAMSGTCTNLGVTTGSDTLTIHGLFTGSVQGQHAILNNDLLGFVGSATSQAIVSNYATVAFSDVFSKPTIVPLTSGFVEQPVAIQPFVFVKSTAPVGVSKITGVTFQQIQSMIVPGTAPLSYFTGSLADTNVIYLLHRSLDSGTRVTTIQETKSTGVVKVRYWDNIGHGFTNGGTLGPALYGAGYVSGSNVRTALQGGDSANQSIAYLSMADAITITTTNWSNILTYNGGYPIANWTPTNTPAGNPVGVSGQVGSGIATTNDYSPVTTGKYSFWAFEVLDYPTSSQWASQLGQNLNYSTQFTPLVNRLTATYSGTPLNGSIDYEVELSKTIAPYATAVRINDSAVARSAVGGVISP